MFTFKKKKKTLKSSTPGEGNGNPLQYLAWEIPWTEEPGDLQSMGSKSVRHDWATSLHFKVIKIEALAYIAVSK